MKKAAIFDMDGLLFDTERLYQESWVEMAERFGQVPSPGFPQDICGSSGEQSLDIIRKHYPAVDAQAFLDGGIARVAELAAESLPEKPGAREILDFLKEHGAKLAVASSSPPEMIAQNLKQSGLERYFDAVVSGKQIPNGKPHPDIFLEAARLLGFSPTDCYVFEDGINGARAGIAAGCVTVLVPDLLPPTPDLLEHCAAICNNLLDARNQIVCGRL